VKLSQPAPVRDSDAGMMKSASSGRPAATGCRERKTIMSTMTATAKTPAAVSMTICGLGSIGDARL
jgi:hypothetical protein